MTAQLDMRFKPAKRECGQIISGNLTKWRCHLPAGHDGQHSVVQPEFRPKKRDICAIRHRGNAESTAANPTSLTKTLQASLIYNWFLKHPGSTCEQCEEGTGILHQSCGARISDLKCSGHLVKVGRGTTRSGSTAAMYEAQK